jgi:hypothetical protein
MAMTNKPNMFGVVRRVVPAHGVKVGCTAESVATGLFREEADTLADALQEQNPDEEYAVTELVFHRWTKEQKS